jgi:hypothetical protein
MHCANCGTVLSQNLNFCQHCGSRSNRRGSPAAPAATSHLLISAGGVTGVVGLMAFFPILRELLHSGAGPELIFLVLAAYLLTVLAMFSVFIWQGAKSRRGMSFEDTPHKTDEVYRSPTFRGVDTAQLEPSNQRPASVTEHTTRTLDDVPVRQ